MVKLTNSIFKPAPLGCCLFIMFILNLPKLSVLEGFYQYVLQ